MAKQITAKQSKSKSAVPLANQFVASPHDGNGRADFLTKVEDLRLEISARSDSLITRTEEMHVAEKNQLIARLDLESARNQILCAGDPKELGNNAEQREAKLRLLTDSHAVELTAADADLRSAKNAVHIATLELDALKLKLRCFEIVGVAILGK